MWRLYLFEKGFLNYKKNKLSKLNNLIKSYSFKLDDNIDK